MLKIKKGNVILDITEDRLKGYLEEGFDQIDPKTGKVIQKATGGKTYSIPEFRALEEENERLRAQLDALKNSKADK